MREAQFLLPEGWSTHQPYKHTHKQITPNLRKCEHTTMSAICLTWRNAPYPWYEDSTAHLVA